MFLVDVDYIILGELNSLFYLFFVYFLFYEVEFVQELLCMDLQFGWNLGLICILIYVVLIVLLRDYVIYEG